MPAHERIRAIAARAAERSTRPAKLPASVKRIAAGKVAGGKTPAGRAAETGHVAPRRASTAVTLAKAAVTLGKSAVMRAAHTPATHAPA